MQLSSLKYFLEISQTKNITLAAKNLHLSQPSLSFAVKTLEDELGVSLLIRHAHSVSLTDAGEKFAAYAEEIINSVENLADMMKAHAKLSAGNLKLGMLWIGGYMNLFALLNEFKAKYPAVSYELAFDGSDVLIHKLLSRRLHGVFMISSPAFLEAQNELYSVKLSTEEYMLIVPKNNALAKNESLSMKDLSHETIIMPSAKTLLHRQLSLMFDELGISPKVLCSTSQPDIVGQLTSEGLALGFASSTVAKKICPDNCRVIPFCDDEKIQRVIYYVTLKELLDYPLTKAFAEFIECKGNLKAPK